MAALTLGFIGALLGSPAQASGTLTVGVGSITATLGTDQVVYFCDSSVSAATCGLSANSLYSGLSTGTYTSGSSVMRTSPFGPASLPAGTYNVAIVEAPPSVSSFTVASENNVVIGSGGGSTTSGPAASTPVEVSLSLDLAASGASCKEGSAATGVSGAWLTLPGADDCSSTTTPNAKLLGWSTSANFPVALAQSQIDKGWGAIDDTFGGVRMIFIPAGQSAFVSGPNSLHPIWAR